MANLNQNFHQTIRSRIREDYLTCAICFNEFTSPKALPCIHTFCEGCLRDYVVGRSYEAIGKFPCPTCRTEVEIPSQGISGFPDNHMIKSLLQDVDNSNNEPQPTTEPSGNVVHPTRPVPAPRTISPGPVPAPRSKSPRPVPAPRSKSPNTNTPETDQGNFKGASPTNEINGVSPDQVPADLPLGPAPEKPPRQGLEVPDQTGPSRQYLDFGAIVSGGIGGVTGAIGSAISDISSYLQAPKSAPQNAPMSPFELVPQPSQLPGTKPSTHPYKALYPQLSVEYSGPCTKNLLLSIGKFGAGVDLFFKPFGLAVGQHGEFVVTDRGGNRIFVFSNEATLKCRFSVDCAVNDVAITKDNHILIAVARSGSAIMRMHNMEGRFLQSFGNFHKFDISSGIVVTPSNHVAITNIEANNVLVFTEQRKFSLKFGSKGAGEKHFNQPRHITATSKDYIVVADTGNNCLKLFDKEGNFKRSFGSVGNAHGQLNGPLGVACDADDNVIVADANNFRVEVYTVKGTFYTTLVEDTYLIGPDVKPINVAVTTRNNIAVLLYGTGFAEVRVYNWRPNHKNYI